MIDRTRIIFISATTLFVVALMAGVYVWRNGNPFKKILPRNAVIVFNCSSIKPASLDLKIGDVVNFINAGDVEHQIKVDGNIFKIQAGETKKIKPDFTFGPASYGYDCDSVAVAGQIQAISAKQGEGALGQDENLKTVSFKESYDLAPDDKKPCLRAVLGQEFQTAYDDADYVPKDVYAVVKNMDKCFAVNANPSE